MDKIQQLAADTLLERGVRFPIPAPFLLRAFGKKNVSITIHQPKMGTLIAISKGYLDLGIDTTGIDDGDLRAAHELIAKHGKGICKVLAVSLLNGRLKIKLFSGILGRWLFWKLSAEKINRLFILITLLSGVKDFCDTIRLLPAMNVMKKKEEELSPTTNGS